MFKCKVNNGTGQHFHIKFREGTVSHQEEMTVVQLVMDLLLITLKLFKIFMNFTPS